MGRRGRRPLQNDRGTGQDAVPYTRFNIPSCRAEPVCPAAGYAFFGGTHGSRPTGCSSHTGRTESSAPTKSVIARSEATRQSVLPSPKKRIPTPVTRSLARNDRNRRRDTRVPPYRVRRFYGAPQPYTCTKKKSCPKAALFDLVISGVRLRSSPAPS